MRCRAPRSYYDDKQSSTLPVLGYLAKLIAATLLAAIMAVSLVTAIDKHQQQNELAAEERAAIVASWGK